VKSFLLRSNAQTEFVGRRLPDAVGRARRELGEDAKIRCWKVRRGGLWGFFAHESFVAGLSVPAGALVGAPVEVSPEEDLGEVHSEKATERGNPGAFEEVESGDSMPLVLDDLVAATDDQLILGVDDATRRAFGEVLAQAEALLTRPPRGGASSVTYERPESHRDVVRVPALRVRLAQLGVPEEYLPDEGEGFDALWACVTRLPSAEPLVAGAGQVIAVVGSRRDAWATAAALVPRMELAERDIFDEKPSNELRRRLQRRRRSARTSIIIVEAPVGRATHDARQWLAQLGAHRVIAAVGANAKRSEVRRWLDQLDGVDALACWRLGRSASVADLMGLAPICLLEGAPATPMSWMVQLVGALGESES